mgnify:CR=1 FL=1
MDNSMKIKLVLTSLFILSCSMAAIGQNVTMVKLGASFPMGNFGESNMDNEKWGLIDNSKKGGAGTGAVIGLQWQWKAGKMDGLNFICSADVLFNFLNEDVNDFFDDYRDRLEDNYDDYSLTSPKYLNIPVMAGLNYTLPISDKLTVMGEAGIGANFRKITNMHAHAELGENESDNIAEFNSALTMAYRIGAGIKFSERYSLHADYYVLGAAKVKGTATMESNYSSESNTFKAGTINPTMLTIRLGIAL